VPFETMSRRDLASQSILLRAASINEKERSVEAVLTTGNAVPVFDWNDWEMVDEVLIPEGAEYADQIPLLESHMRWDTGDLLGSIRSIRREGDNQIVGRLFFVEGDPDVEKVWNKVRQGHLTDVSIGYQIIESVKLEPNTRANIGGREFAAGPRSMRVATKYRIKEGSAVVIGADQAAKIRAEQLPPSERHTMPKQAQGASPPEVEKPVESVRSEADKPGERSEGENPGQSKPAAAPGLTELDRQKQIRKLAKLNTRAIDDELVERCLDDPACTPDMAADLFLGAHRAERKPPVGAKPKGNVEVKDDERMAGIRLVSLAFATRGGVDVRRVADKLRGGCYSGQSKSASPLAGRSKDELDELVRQADRFVGWSQDKLLERALEVCGVEIPDNRLDMHQRALSTPAVQDLFTTNVQAQLLVGYLEADDTTTQGFVEETDVENYLTAEAVDLSKMGGMKKRTRGKSAEHGDMSSNKETYSVSSYSEQFTCDEMDLINDRFGAIQQKAPKELGADARRLRPDLVYSLLLANPTLAQDSVAVFHATHGNLLTGGTYAMSKAALEYAMKTMMAQYELRGKQKIRLNLRPKWIIVPTGLGNYTEELIGSSKLLATGLTDAVRGDMNALVGKKLVVIEEPRIDATGCWNPVTEAMVTGSATNWFMLSDQRKSIQVAYLRGTGRLPRLRSKFFDSDGLYGMQWDVEHSIGSAILGYRDLLKANGA